jgi:hypothetical protein
MRHAPWLHQYLTLHVRHAEDLVGSWRRGLHRIFVSVSEVVGARYKR